MNQKLKTFFYILAVIVAVIVTAVIFSFTLFTVKDIKIDYKTSLEGTYSEEEIVEKSGLKYGKCVFFLKKNQFSSNIEKNFPYLEVINIETKIPSHIIIHLAERQEFYAVTHNGQTLICDDEFKVLRVESGTSYESTTNNAITLYGDKLDIENSNIEAGDFLNIKQKGLYNLYNRILENSRSRAEMLASFKEININAYEEKEVIKDGRQVVKEMQTSICITNFADRKIYISNIDYGLKYKFQKMFAVLSSLADIKQFKYDGQIYDIENSSTEKKQAMVELLAKAEIHIENYLSEYQINDQTGKIEKVFSEKDCFFFLQVDGKLLERI